jgi:predicted nucleic acid-binding protein
MTEAMTPLRIAAVGEKEQRGAAALLRRFADQDLTLADAFGLHLMRDRGMSHCWSTDFHLGLTGVPLVINER